MSSVTYLRQRSFFLVRPSGSDPGPRPRPVLQQAPYHKKPTRKQAQSHYHKKYIIPRNFLSNHFLRPNAKAQLLTLVACYIRSTSYDIVFFFLCSACSPLLSLANFFIFPNKCLVTLQNLLSKFIWWGAANFFVIFINLSLVISCNLPGTFLWYGVGASWLLLLCRVVYNRAHQCTMYLAVGDTDRSMAKWIDNRFFALNHNRPDQNQPPSKYSRPDIHRNHSYLLLIFCYK